ncbi:MAG: flagellar protein FliS [Clostridiaceae bacterium]|nr:flagellar protein FliS [Clostridiaceae bacterium]
MARPDSNYIASKVVNATPLQLTLITYEGIFKALDEAREAYENKDYVIFDTELARAELLLDELFTSLDFDVDLSKDIGAIYFFCKNQLSIAAVTRKESMLEDVKKILTPLYEGFNEISSTQEAPAKANKKITGIVAGMTYGKGNLTETVLTDPNSGFKV